MMYFSLRTTHPWWTSLCKVIGGTVLVWPLLPWRMAYGAPPTKQNEIMQLREKAIWLDAIIAAGKLEDELSWNDITSLWQCLDADHNDESKSTGERQLEDISSMIPLLIDQALQKAKVDMGRIYEHTNVVDLPLGENYQALVKGATMVCLVADDPRPGVSPGASITVGPVAYASHLVDNNLYMIAQSEVVDANITMLLEADVMELGTEGMLHIPRKYCMDLEDRHDVGITLGSGSTNVMSIKDVEEVNRLLSFGARTGSILSFRNHVTWWVTKDDDKTTGGEAGVKSFYSDPKIELVALARAIDNDVCLSDDPYVECFDKAMKEYSGTVGFENLDPSVKMTAIRQHMYIVDAFWKWESVKHSLVLEGTDGWESPLADLYPTENFLPLVFADGIADWGKNSLWPSVQANPYYSLEDLEKRTGGLSDDQRREFLKCVNGGVDRDVDDVASTKTANAAMHLPFTIRRRRYEHSDDIDSKLTEPEEWALFLMEVPQTLNSLLGSLIWKPEVDAQYLAQTIQWEATGELQAGNLTRKLMGKTADWFVVTDHFNDARLQQLLERHNAMDAYSETLSKAVHLDNPCSEAVTDIEVYILIFSMAVAACGGVTAVLASVHHMIYWAAYMVQGEKEEATPTSCTGWKRFLPTYELILAAFGGLVFLVLFLPVYAQFLTEKEIASYRTSASNAHILYGKMDSGYPGYPTLVTIAYSETECISARSDLLLTLFIVGLVASLVVNAPFLWRSYNALARYCTRVRHGESEIPPNCAFTDENLRLLSPPSMTHDEDDEESQSLVSSGSGSSVHSTSGAKTLTTASPTQTEKQAADKDARPQIKGKDDSSGWSACGDKKRSSDVTDRTASMRALDESSSSNQGDIENSRKVVYENVVYRKTVGKLILSADGLSFISAEPGKDKFIYRFRWNDAKKCCLNKASNPTALIKFVIHKDSNNQGEDEEDVALFRLPNRIKLEHLRDKVAERMRGNANKHQQDSLDPTDTSFSQSFSQHDDLDASSRRFSSK